MNLFLIFLVFLILDEYDDEDNGSPIQPKWHEETIEEAVDLFGNPLDPRNTRSQFHTTFSACEVVLDEK